MAARFVNLFHREPKPQRETIPHLSHLQKAILSWLYREGQRRQQRGESTALPFVACMRGLTAEKAEIVTSLRRLMQKSLLEVSLPRGEWTRYVSLTALGEKHAKTLSKDTRSFATYFRHPGKIKYDRAHDRGERRRR
jgi:hypothetical protein